MIVVLVVIVVQVVAVVVVVYSSVIWWAFITCHPISLEKMVKYQSTLFIVCIFHVSSCFPMFPFWFFVLPPIVNGLLVAGFAFQMKYCSTWSCVLFEGKTHLKKVAFATFATRYRFISTVTENNWLKAAVKTCFTLAILFLVPCSANSQPIVPFALPAISQKIWHTM